MYGTSSTKRRNKITTGNTFTTKKEYFTPDYATHILHKTE